MAVETMATTVLSETETEGLMRYLQLKKRYDSPQDLVAEFKLDAGADRCQWELDDELLGICAQLVIEEVTSWGEPDA